MPQSLAVQPVPVQSHCNVAPAPFPVTLHSPPCWQLHVVSETREPPVVGSVLFTQTWVPGLRNFTAVKAATVVEILLHCMYLLDGVSVRE